MANDKALGGVILVGSIVAIIVYALILYWFPLIVLQITAFLGIVVLLGILAWIGWTMATTPAPEPIPEVPSTSAATSPSTVASDKKPEQKSA